MTGSLAGVLQIGLLVLALAACYKPLGDYKPFGMAELLARLRAALRRDEAASQPAPAVAAIGRWTIDLTAHTISNQMSERSLPTLQRQA